MYATSEMFRNASRLPPLLVNARVGLDLTQNLQRTKDSRPIAIDLFQGKTHGTRNNRILILTRGDES